MSKILIEIIIFANFFKIILSQYCNVEDYYFCKNTENEDYSSPEEWDNYAFQTPPRFDIMGRYKNSYQDMGYFVGYVRLEYSSNKDKCIMTFITRVNPKVGKEGINYYILYKFGEYETRNNTKEFSSRNDSYPDGLSVSARVILIKNNLEILKLELEDEYFLWDNPIITQSRKFNKGQKGAIVELFGWPYDDIAEECEFLSHAGYLGLKVFSPNEHLQSVDAVEGGVLNPWWYGTQTVSFKFESRFGNKKQLKKMINKCRSKNVRVYAEVVINHMTGEGNDCYDNHCDNQLEKRGSGGSPFWTFGNINENNPYTNQKFQNEYPSVPYFPSDFHCFGEITDWDNPIQLCNGYLATLVDVNTEKEYPRQRIADYFTELISIGFSGISIPNVRHMPSFSMAQILKKFKANLGNKLPDDLLIIMVLEGVEGIAMELALCNKDSIINYGNVFTDHLIDAGFSYNEIDKIKLWFKGCLKDDEDELSNSEPLCNEKVAIPIERWTISLEFSDDINRGDTGYNIYIKHKNIEAHRSILVERMFKNPKYDWQIRFIFTSFSLYHDLNGIPDGKSECTFCETDECKKNCVDIPYRKAYNPLSKGYDCGNEENWVEGEYSRIHRDLLIINAMRKWMFPKKDELTEEELYGQEQEKMKMIQMNCSEKCLTCDNNTIENDLCLSCNKSKGFYPLIYGNDTQEYFECYHISSFYEKIYFNKTEDAFKPCYHTCKTCNKDGNEESVVGRYQGE